MDPVVKPRDDIEQVFQATYKYFKIIKRLCKQIIQNQTLIKQLSKSGGLLLL
ncbi:MAG: hypothetical protein LN590_04395 [Rickettsia endosymbiont of Glossina mortisans submortisans]|nr:hypothetical protein [Rickettsia endosymbiont of Glossina mortisans submortisans]